MTEINPEGSMGDFVYPNSDGGMVWWGHKAATKNDIINLQVFLGEDVVIDEPSLVGLYHPLWVSVADAKKEHKYRKGGIGSIAYENQFVKSGVYFWPQQHDPDGGWYWIDGEMVKGTPPDAGACHKVYNDGYNDVWAGPEPDTEAEKFLGGSKYYFDIKQGVYQVNGKEGEVEVPTLRQLARYLKQ